MTQNTINSEKFLEAFNQIEIALANRFRPGYHVGFAELIRRMQSQDAMVKRFSNDLRAFAELRNAIVHTRRENFVIAEPHSAIVDEIERIKSLIINPPTVAKLTRKKTYTTTRKSTLEEVLLTFKNNNFTRCPVLDGNKMIGLLTARSIARWLASSINEAPVLARTTVEQVLPWAEKEKYVVVHPKTKIHEIYELFKSQLRSGNSLQAVIVTRNGKPFKPILSILTPSDLPQLFSVIDNQD